MYVTGTAYRSISPALSRDHDPEDPFAYPVTQRYDRCCAEQRIVGGIRSAVVHVTKFNFIC